MNAWDNVNIYTEDYTQWAGFMNLTTREWNLSPFPPNVVAIPGSPQDGDYDFPTGTIIIQNTSRAKLVTRDIEKVVFGTASGVVIAVMLAWVLWRWKELRQRVRAARGKAARDPVRAPMLPDNSGSSVTAFEDGGGSSDKFFRRELARYYDNVVTMPEVGEKETGGSVDVEDIEAVNNLLREMFEVDIDIFAMSNDTGVWPGQIEGLKLRRDDILDEVKRLIERWSYYSAAEAAWESDEKQLLKSIYESLWGHGAIQRRSDPQAQEPPADRSVRSRQS